MDSGSLKILELLSNRVSLTIGNLAAIFNTDYAIIIEVVQQLLKLGYIRIEDSVVNEDSLLMGTPIAITYLGYVVIEQEKKANRKEKLAWARYIITTLIAFAALIISIISLLK